MKKKGLLKKAAALVLSMMIAVSLLAACDSTTEKNAMEQETASGEENKENARRFCEYLFK